MLTLFETVKILHIESTDVCQAACPLCLRETDPMFDKEQRTYLTVDKLKTVLSLETMKQLEKVFLCGNYGDPAASDAISIFEYFKEHDSNITLGMNTNGGLQSTQWWKSIAGLLNKQQDYVVFSIDGLSDTNDIYRRNVNWGNVMRNAQSFIDSGGNAHWDMLIYEHNEHQVKDCEALAKSMGFKWFRAKVSKRVNHTVGWLNPPKKWSLPTIISNNIDCSSLKEDSLYINAMGEIFPCCWQANHGTNLKNFKILQDSWNSLTPNDVCKTVCGTRNSKNSFTNQWQHIIEF
jgi:sulfatase maturation enzyme AslB (radical SAM superfamily)